MNLLIVILNYRTPGLTIDCLRSLAPQIDSVPDTRVVVVDNGSGDGSPQTLQRAIEENRWSGWASLFVSQRNLGFAGGNNFGVRAGGISRYILLLNSDTIVHPGTLRHCYDVMEQDRWIGAMSCALLSPDGSVQNVARRFPNPLREAVTTLGLAWRFPRLLGWASVDDPTWDRRTVRRDVDWIGGAFFFVRGNLYRRLGGLDEDFFFWGEDVDFCKRMRRCGYRCHYDPRATITHLGGGSPGIDRNPQRAPSPHHWRSRYLVQRKCYGRFAAWFVRTLDVANYAGRSAWLTLTRREPDKRDRYVFSLRSIARP